MKLYRVTTEKRAQSRIQAEAGQVTLTSDVPIVSPDYSAVKTADEVKGCKFYFIDYMDAVNFMIKKEFFYKGPDEALTILVYDDVPQDFLKPEKCSIAAFPTGAQAFNAWYTREYAG